MCASRNSLVSQMARIGERLQLDSRVCDFLPTLQFDDGSINVLLQVDEPPVVAHRLTGRDVRLLHKVRVAHFVRPHDIVHVHADGVAHLGRQGG